MNDGHGHGHGASAPEFRVRPAHASSFDVRRLARRINKVVACHSLPALAVPFVSCFPVSCPKLAAYNTCAPVAPPSALQNRRGIKPRNPSTTPSASTATRPPPPWPPPTPTRRPTTAASSLCWPRSEKTSPLNKPGPSPSLATFPWATKTASLNGCVSPQQLVQLSTDLARSGLACLQP